ncbi:Uncharacterised protein [Chlamydia abortus]|nr:Uncharacterised protein [Chlamydia abortus]
MNTCALQIGKGKILQLYFYVIRVTVNGVSLIESFYKKTEFLNCEILLNTQLVNHFRVMSTNCAVKASGNECFCSAITLSIKSSFRIYGRCRVKQQT